MSERHKTHNGRDQSGHFKVKQVDAEDLRTEPNGDEFLRDDVRLGGAIEDTSLEGVERARRIGELVEQNRDDVQRVAEPLRDEGSP